MNLEVDGELKQQEEHTSILSRNRIRESRSQKDKGDGLASGQGTMESKSSRAATASKPSKSPVLGTGKSTPGQQKAKSKPLNTTSAEQLQVYLKPEYKNFTEVLNPRNP